MSMINILKKLFNFKKDRKFYFNKQAEKRMLRGEQNKYKEHRLNIFYILKGEINGK